MILKDAIRKNWRGLAFGGLIGFMVYFVAKARYPAMMAITEAPAIVDRIIDLSVEFKFLAVFVLAGMLIGGVVDDLT